MEFLKNFIVGLAVLVLSILLIGVSLVIWPLILVASSIILLSLKVVLYIGIFTAFVVLIGYVARKGFKKSS